MIIMETEQDDKILVEAKLGRFYAHVLMPNDLEEYQVKTIYKKLIQAINRKLDL